ncbi:DUF2029 domain-containing protein [Candidatus Parcubacteria bacterium]|nr:MAG: DUF2029 domain-containing protein [Candidatus Parcubacteria bacterium]
MRIKLASISFPFHSAKRLADYILRVEEGVWWALALGTGIGLMLIYGQVDIVGRDWRVMYRPATLADDFLVFPGVANPLYIKFLFYPLAVLPTLAGYAGILALNVVSYRMIAYFSGINKWLIFPSFPALWMLVYGQIDGLVALGVALGAWALREKKPYIQGIAILLLMLKPHVGGVLALVFFVWQKDWRALVISGMVIGLSLWVGGPNWPIAWVRRLLAEAAQASRHEGFAGVENSFNNIGLFPYGLLFWIFVLWRYPYEEKIAPIVASSILSMPYAGNYSLLSVMAGALPGWVYPLFSMPFLGWIGYKLVVLAPIIVVLRPVVKYHWGSMRRQNTLA